MKHHLFRLFLLLLFIPASQLSAQIEPTAGMMRFPDISEDHIVFCYADDIWIVDRDGGKASPLASPKGAERFPRFSPDGKKIAFMGNYEGGNDIYTIGVGGGLAERVTYHPSTELLSDWTADGKGFIYSSAGFSGLGRVLQLFTISKDKPLPQQLPVPYGSNGAISADGKWLAYTPHSRDNRTWKRYRGGMASDIWLFNLEDNTSKQITNFDGTDSIPMWHDSTVYYLSDAGKAHRLNIWSFDTKTGERKQITKFSDDDIKWPSIGPGRSGEGEIVFSAGSSMYILNLESGESKPLSVTVPGDRPALRRQRIDASEFIQSGDVSATGKRVAIEARGDIWTAPAKKGSPRNLTRSAGSAERFPSWSPDGRWIAYLSDATGEYEMYITQSDGRGETKQLTKDGSCYRYGGQWSPDSKHLAFADKTGALYLLEVESGETKKIDTDPFSQPIDVSWSHDSNWICYSRATDARTPSSNIWVYNITDGTRRQLTSGFFQDSSPAFDRKGEYIYYVSSRVFNSPKYEDVGTTFIYSGTQVILAMPLRADIEYPLLPKSDEETWKEEKKEDDEDEDEDESKDEESDESDDDDQDGDSEDGDEEDDNDESEEDDDDGDAESDDPVSGSWDIQLLSDAIPEEARNASMNLQLGEDGKTVTGSVNSPQGEQDISSGTFDKESGDLKLIVEVAGQSVTVNATIDGDSMTGTVDMGGQSIDFEATRSGGGDSDEEDDDEKEGDDEAEDKKKGKKDKDKKKKEKDPIKIDFDGIERRAFQLPMSAGSYGSLVVNDKNHLIFASRSSRGGGGSTGIKIFDIKDEKKAAKTVVAGAANFDISGDGKKLIVMQGDSAYVISAAAGQKLSDKVNTRGMTVMVDPREEWKQIFWEAWRLERDFFYDPTMHGVDWEAVGKHYEKMLDDCVSRRDVGFIIREMISEINVGHAYYRPGNLESGPRASVGQLGCRFEIDGDRYKMVDFAEGADWDSDARNPLKQAGIKEGQYLLEINGVDLKTDESPYMHLEGTTGQTVSLTVSDDKEVDDDDKRILYKPIGSDANLRFRAWIEKNRKYVDEESGGKVGYIYVVNTGVPGQNDLVRQLYGQFNKEALIIDDRWNGGGQIPTRFIELLNRPSTNYWARRDGRDWSWPPDSHFGPKCMLINGMAGSGGDMFPALFRQNELGKLIGTRTWGGLVGISGSPPLLDGASVTVPSFAYYEKDGTWGIEGHGVDPDIKVIDDPAKMLDGADPQLDEAIDLMLKEIEKNGYKAPKRPDYPDRSRMGIAPEDK